MTQDTVIGIILISCGLGFITYITFRSRRIIELITRRKSGTVREIMKDLQDDG